MKIIKIGSLYIGDTFRFGNTQSSLTWIITAIEDDAFGYEVRPLHRENYTPIYVERSRYVFI